MDIRAFGSVYGQQSALPYASGFRWEPSEGQTTFPTSRAVFIENNQTSSRADVYIRLNDMGEDQILHVENIAGDILLPFGAVTLSGGSINAALVLY